MTGPTDTEQALTEWGREAREVAASTAPTQPRIAELVAGHRSTPLRWRAVAATVILTAAVGGTVGLISARHSDHQAASHRTPSPAAAMQCVSQFGVSSVSFTQRASILSVELTYQGRADCRLASGAPGLLLVSAHGVVFGSAQELARLGGYHHQPPSSLTVRVHPGATVSFHVQGFHDCLDTPSDSYTLRVALDSPTPPTRTSGIAVPIGQLKPSGLLCLTAGLGGTSKLTVSPTAPTAHPS